MGTGGLGPPLDPPASPTSHADVGRILELLRMGLGMIWALNLIFIVDPANRFFPTFATTALAFAPSTLTGPSLPEAVASFPFVFALVIALMTFYLALAFLTGTTTRWACVIGAAFSLVLLITQWGTTFAIPGGTDVGPQPLYLLLYGTLFFGGAGRSITLRAWLSEEGGPDVVRDSDSGPPTLL